MSDTKSIAVMPMDYSPAHWQAMKEMAKEFSASGALPAHLSNAARVVMVLQAGAEMGIPPMQAINTLYIINGKVAMEGRAMLKQVMAGGVKVKWKVSTPETCTVVLSREGFDEHEETYSIDEAKSAGLLDKKGDVWKKYPKDMLRWRALSRASRFYCPDITEGVHLVEEIADTGKGARYNEEGVITVESSSPIADQLLEEIKDCADRKTYMADILPKIKETGAKLSYGERAAITKAAEQRLEEFAKSESKAKSKPDVEATQEALRGEETVDVEDGGKKEDGRKEDPSAVDSVEITAEDMSTITNKIRGMKKQAQLISYVQDEVLVMPLTETQKKEVYGWVKNKIAQVNGKIPTDDDMKTIFQS